MSGDDKFDTPGVGLPSNMFASAAELIGWKDMEIPAPSHANPFVAWRETTEDDVAEIITGSGVDLGFDEASFNIGKDFTLRALEKFVAKAKVVGWGAQDAETRREAAEAILTRPQIPQRTQAWYAQGKQVLTASEFSKMLGAPRAVSQLVSSKVPSESVHGTNRLACMTCEMGPFDWGVRFEPVVKQILERDWGVKIAEAGRILHPTDPHLAASPDGIYLEATDPARVGRLVEIKCPITRKIGEGIPFEYWCQMQIQMEVTGIGECDYVEVKFDSPSGTTTDISGTAEGYIWLLQNPTTCEMKYAYTEEDVEWDVVEKIPWRMKGMYTETISRDRGWFESTRGAQREFWENVEKAKQGSFVEKPRVVVKKEPAECLIMD